METVIPGIDGYYILQFIQLLLLRLLFLSVFRFDRWQGDSCIQCYFRTNRSNGIVRLCEIDSVACKINLLRFRLKGFRNKASDNGSHLRIYLYRNGAQYRSFRNGRVRRKAAKIGCNFGPDCVFCRFFFLFFSLRKRIQSKMGLRIRIFRYDTVAGNDIVGERIGEGAHVIRAIALYGKDHAGVYLHLIDDTAVVGKAI